MKIKEKNFKRKQIMVEPLNWRYVSQLREQTKIKKNTIWEKYDYASFERLYKFSNFLYTLPKKVLLSTLFSHIILLVFF